MLGSDGTRQVITDQQLASGKYGTNFDSNGNLSSITTAQGTFDAQFFNATPNFVSANVYGDLQSQALETGQDTSLNQVAQQVFTQVGQQTYGFNNLLTCGATAAYVRAGDFFGIPTDPKDASLDVAKDGLKEFRNHKGASLALAWGVAVATGYRAKSLALFVNKNAPKFAGVAGGLISAYQIGEAVGAGINAYQGCNQ